MKIFIITGASRGIGNALATILEAEGHKVLRIARSNPGEFSNLMTLDITAPDAPSQIMGWLKPLLPIASEITLINNAGVIEPIEQVGALDPQLIDKAIAINITAPIKLSNAFVEATQALPITKRIVNISSGAGRHVYEGWSIYCTTKAAIDHFSRALYLEQQAHTFPIAVTALAPGVIDTDMQTQIRQSEASSFPNVARFIEMKERGTLLSPHQCATKIINYLNSPQFLTDDPITDIREM